MSIPRRSVLGLGFAAALGLTGCAQNPPAGPAGSWATPAPGDGPQGGHPLRSRCSHTSNGVA
ncbi:hypothetical protein, partial [Micromonospora sp. S-DT3-3-22]|uniref:hypothetical protein n=1 Tax=Micromonospora sp. S-DT3-3-22 TaxID=2755359 RepID=UPI001E2C0CA9